MLVKNYYTILNVDSDSDLNAVKKAFRKEIAIYHPDNNNSEEAKERFNDLVEGFNILSDPEKRKVYNTMLIESQNNKPMVIAQQEQYSEWREESKTKSKKYRESSLTELFLLDIFTDVGFQGLLEGSKVVLEESESLFEGLGDVLGDIAGGIFDGL